MFGEGSIPVQESTKPTNPYRYIIALTEQQQQSIVQSRAHEIVKVLTGKKIIQIVGGNSTSAAVTGTILIILNNISYLIFFLDNGEVIVWDCNTKSPHVIPNLPGKVSKVALGFHQSAIITGTYGLLFLIYQFNLCS